jgi:hypothetical protein
LALSVHTADNGVQHTGEIVALLGQRSRRTAVVTADDGGWHVKIGTVQSDGFKSILNVSTAHDGNTECRLLQLMQFLNGYVKLLPPWGPPQEADVSARAFFGGLLTMRGRRASMANCHSSLDLVLS